MRFHRLRVDGRRKRMKKFAFTSVCVYNRLRVGGALAFLAAVFWDVTQCCPLDWRSTLCDILLLCQFSFSFFLPFRGSVCGEELGSSLENSFYLVQNVVSVVSFALSIYTGGFHKVVDVL